MIDRTIWRLIDVNANRVAEGLRTIEDIARVVFENEVVCSKIKSLRHSTSEAIAELDRHSRLVARDTGHDAGTQITTDAERQRPSWDSILIAAMERSLQALRCLEEFTKPIGERLSERFKQLRYLAYDTLAEVELALTLKPSTEHGRLYLLVDCQRPMAEFADYLSKLFDSGVDWIQIRDKSIDGGQLVDYTRAAMQVARRFESNSRRLVIVNDRLDVALAARADGVHLGQEDLAIEDARRAAGKHLVIGVSTHSLEQAERAVASGADYIGCGPTFPTVTKSFEDFPGLPYLRQVSGRFPVAAFAIGGIAQHNLAEVLATGIRRIAVSSAIHAAKDPIATARQMRAILDANP